jgi:hypothetical protein
MQLRDITFGLQIEGSRLTQLLTHMVTEHNDLQALKAEKSHIGGYTTVRALICAHFGCSETEAKGHALGFLHADYQFDLTGDSKEFPYNASNITDETLRKSIQTVFGITLWTNCYVKLRIACADYDEWPLLLAYFKTTSEGRIKNCKVLIKSRYFTTLCSQDGKKFLLHKEKSSKLQRTVTAPPAVDFIQTPDIKIKTLEVNLFTSFPKHLRMEYLRKLATGTNVT